MAVDDIYRAALIQRIGTDEFVNVLHYKVTLSANPPAIECMALAAAIEETAQANWRALAPDTCTLDTISVRGVTVPTVGYDHASGIVGLRTGDVLPYQVSPLVLLRSGKIGRAYNGKIYLLPAMEVDSIAGTIVNAARVLMEAYVSDLESVTAAAYPGQAFQLGVWSRKYSLFNPVQTTFLMAQLRTQRRRTPGRGS